MVTRNNAHSPFDMLIMIFCCVCLFSESSLKLVVTNLIEGLSLDLEKLQDQEQEHSLPHQLNLDQNLDLLLQQVQAIYPFQM